MKFDDKAPPPPQPDRPELCRIRSTSQPGRAFRHQHRWAPPHCRLPPAPAARAVHANEEQLLYLALYRDKVAQHHAEAEASAVAASSSSTRRRNGGATGQQTATPLEEVDADNSMDDAAIHSTELPQLIRPEQWFSPSPRIDTCGSDAGHGADKTPRGLRRVRHPVDNGARDSRAATHIASVTVRATFGGVTSEHLEAKQLGHLYDQWRTQQAELEGGMDSPLSSSSKRAAYFHGAGGAVPQRANAGAPAATAPRGALGAIGRGAAEGDGGGDQVGSELDDSEHSCGGGIERRRLERLYNVITNPKVRCESFAERGMSDSSARPPPTHIEGFPPLGLVKLYQGPWRLNV